MSKRGTTDNCQCVLERCANGPSYEVVGIGSGYDTDSDDSDVEIIPKNLKGEGI